MADDYEMMQFLDPSHSFASGFRLGQLWERLMHGAEIRGWIIWADSVPQLTMMAEFHGMDMFIEYDKDDPTLVHLSIVNPKFPKKRKYYDPTPRLFTASTLPSELATNLATTEDRRVPGSPQISPELVAKTRKELGLDPVNVYPDKFPEGAKHFPRISLDGEGNVINVDFKLRKRLDDEEPADH